MATDRELLEGFKSQFNTGRMFNEDQVLILMGYARGEERNAQANPQQEEPLNNKYPSAEEYRKKGRAT